MRVGLVLGIIVAASLSLTQEGFAKQRLLSCNPKGSEMWVIGCMHNENERLWVRLHTHYARYLDSIFAACAKESLGTGAGPFRARTECAAKALDAEAKRVNYKSP